MIPVGAELGEALLAAYVVVWAALIAREAMRLVSMAIRWGHLL